MISTANITIQFGAKPLFENVSVKFSDENRYGLITAKGCGKSTFMKILGNDLAATSGTVTIMGVTIATDVDTKFEDGDDAPISGTSFFGTVSPGDPAEFQDKLPADGVADEVEIE